MAKYDKISPETQQEAMKIARANQKPGQTKEQTQLIAQGIQKGIDEYKKTDEGAGPRSEPPEKNCRPKPGSHRARHKPKSKTLSWSWLK